MSLTNFISKRLEFVFLALGLIMGIRSMTILKQTLDGLPTVTSSSELQTYLGKDIIFNSPLEPTGYSMVDKKTKAKEMYFYLGAIGNQPLFMADDKEISPQKTPITIIGKVMSNDKGTYYQKLVDNVSRDLKIQPANFNEKFTPYVISIQAVGENAQAEHIKNITNSLIFFGIITGGSIVVMIRKQMIKKNGSEKNNSEQGNNNEDKDLTQKKLEKKKTP